MSRNTEFIPFARPVTDRNEEEAVLRVLRSGWLTTGNETKLFEEEFRSITEAQYALAVNSATSGLHLALEASGIGPGDKVITTPYTFTATAEVIRYLGADPLFADIERSSFNISPEAVESILKKDPAVKAVIPVHVGGRICDMDALLDLKRKYGISIIEDSAHAFPVKYKGRYAGTIGDTGVFSFYATKTITTGEGGMITTSSKAAAERMSVMRLHGIDRDIWNRYTSSSASWEYAVVEAGFKYNMTDLAAAIGREQLKKAFIFLEARKRIARFYNSRFAGADFLECPEETEGHAWHLYMPRIVPGKLGITRNEFLNRLTEQGIGISVHYIPLHIMPYYRNRYGFQPADFPETMNAYESVFSLPIYPALEEEQLNRIVETVIETGENCRRSS